MYKINQNNQTIRMWAAVLFRPVNAESTMSLVCVRHRDETGQQQQQPGICPSCLRERLAQLTADRTIATTGFGVWSDLSPRASCHLRHGSDVERPSASVGVEEGLRKSNSVCGGGGDERRRRKKKKGFWSKLSKMTWQKMT